MNKLITVLLVCLLISPALFAQVVNPADEVKVNGYRQSAMFRVVNDLVEAANNRCFTDAGATVGDPASSTSVVTDSILYTINGVHYAVASSSSIAFSSGHAPQPVLTHCIYLFQVDAAGAWTSVQGPIVSTSVDAQFPRPTSGKCPVFAVKVSLASTATFTPGTTLLSASNVTDTYYDLSVRPISLKY